MSAVSFLAIQALGLVPSIVCFTSLQSGSRLRILRLQHLADAADGAARTDAGAKAVDRPRHLLKNFHRRVVMVRLQIAGIRELLRHKDLRVFPLHPQRRLQALFNSVADVSGVVNQDNLRTVMADKLAAFLADGIGHDDDRTVALDRSDQRKTNALVAAGRLDNDGIRADFAVPLRVFNHLICRARLDRAADIESLKFYQHLSPCGSGRCCRRITGVCPIASSIV